MYARCGVDRRQLDLWLKAIGATDTQRDAIVGGMGHRIEAAGGMPMPQSGPGSMLENSIKAALTAIT